MPDEYRLNCLDANNPYKLQVDGSVITNHGGNSFQYYADGLQYANIRVWSRNIQNFLSTTPLEKSITTQPGLREFMLYWLANIHYTSCIFIAIASSSIVSVIPKP